MERLELGRLPPEMLQAIYKLLPFPDLLSCRLVNSAWKTAATDIVRKRGGPIPIREFPQLKRQKILEHLNALVEDADGHFPVDTFITSNFDDEWLEEFENKNVASLFELFWSVAAFVTEFPLYLELGGGGVPVIQKAKARSSSVEEFPKLKLLELRVTQNKPDFENEDELTLDLIKSIIEKSPKMESISLVLLRNAEVMNTIPRCVEGLGIGANLKLLTSLEFKATFANTDHWQVVSGMGLKLKELTVWMSINAGYQQGRLKAFLESQAETLTSLVIGFDFAYSDLALNSRTGGTILVEFPCLAKLNKLKITGGWGAKIRFSNLCYKSQLPELKELCIHRTPIESYKDLINNQNQRIFEKLERLTFAEMVSSQTEIEMISRFFPNIRKLGILGGGANSLQAVYKYMPQLEELCLKVKDDCVDAVITGLDKIEYSYKFRYHGNPSTHSWNRAIEKLESRLRISSIAALENLKILRIHRDNEDWTGSPNLNDLSVYVLKKLKNLQVIDFGVSRHGPHINVPFPLMAIEDLSEHCALVWKQPSHRRLREFEEESEIDNVSPQLSSNSDLSDTG